MYASRLRCFLEDITLGDIGLSPESLDSMVNERGVERATKRDASRKKLPKAIMFMGLHTVWFALPCLDLPWLGCAVVGSPFSCHSCIPTPKSLIT
jgi:hypothetical protein